MNMNRVLSCIGENCKKMTEASIKFVDSIDPNVQKKIEDDIADGKLMEQTIRSLENKQEEIRSMIEAYMMEISVNTLRNLLNTDPKLSTKIKKIFTYYYTEILDRIPSEMKENMTDTVDAIQNLDESIKLMYCIELMCNPDDYVMNYELDTQFTEDELENEMKKCSITYIDEGKSSYKFDGVRDPYSGITVYKEDPSLGIRKRIRKRMNTTKSGQMTRGGKKMAKKTKKAKKSKKAKKTKAKTAKESKAKKTKAKTAKNAKKAMK